MVAVEWSYLESIIDAAIWNLAHVAEEDVGAAITTHLSIPLRLDMLSTLNALLCDDRVQWDRNFTADNADKRKNELRLLRTEIDTAAKERNSILHARWVRGDHGSPMAYIVHARGTLKRSKQGKPTNDIRTIAQRISECSSRLKAFFEVPAADETFVINEWDS